MGCKTLQQKKKKRKENDKKSINFNYSNSIRQYLQHHIVQYNYLQLTGRFPINKLSHFANIALRR